MSEGTRDYFVTGMQTGVCNNMYVGLELLDW